MLYNMILFILSKLIEIRIIPRRYYNLHAPQRCSLIQFVYILLLINYTKPSSFSSNRTSTLKMQNDHVVHNCKLTYNIHNSQDRHKLIRIDRPRHEKKHTAPPRAAHYPIKSRRYKKTRSRFFRTTKLAINSSPIRSSRKKKRPPDYLGRITRKKTGNNTSLD